jgi:hypothetical protein
MDGWMAWVSWVAKVLKWQYIVIITVKSSAKMGGKAQIDGWHGWHDCQDYAGTAIYCGNNATTRIKMCGKGGKNNAAHRQ